jgi:hypothetical protein
MSKRPRRNIPNPAAYKSPLDLQGPMLIWSRARIVFEWRGGDWWEGKVKQQLPCRAVFRLDLLPLGLSKTDGPWRGKADFAD